MCDMLSDFVRYFPLIRLFTQESTQPQYGKAFDIGKNPSILVTTSRSIQSGHYGRVVKASDYYPDSLGSTGSIPVGVEISFRFSLLFCFRRP